MITGTVISPVTVYYDDGRQAMQARAGDRIEATTINSANKWIVSKLIRNGRSMLPDGLYFVDGSAIRNDAPPPDPQPQTGIRAYIYRNHEKTDTENWRPGQPPIPDTRNIIGAHPSNNGRVVYTRRLQYFLYTNLQARVPEFTIERFNKEFKYWCNDSLAFFNKAGSDTRRVWPLGLRLKSPDMLGNQLIFGGDTIYLLDDQPHMIQDRLRFPLRCIDAFDPNIEDHDSFSHPEEWTRPSITYGPDVERQEPFSQFSGRGRQPLILNGTNIAWIEASKVRILATDEPTPPQFTYDWGS